MTTTITMQIIPSTESDSGQQRCHPSQLNTSSMIHKSSTSSPITLRQFSLTDADSILHWFTTTTTSTQFVHFDPPTSLDQSLHYISTIAIPHPYLRAICLNDIPIGAITVTQNSEHAHRVEMGYIVGERHWGKGIATRAVRLVVEEVVKMMPWVERVEAMVEIGNVASMRVLEKVGFEREGVLKRWVVVKGKARDMVMFSLMTSDVCDRRSGGGGDDGGQVGGLCCLIDKMSLL